jgi:hypothetical protein
MGNYEQTVICFILFSGKKQDWWSGWKERFLAKARHKGFNILLLGKGTIPVSSTVINETMEAGKALQKIVDLKH